MGLSGAGVDLLARPAIALTAATPNGLAGPMRRRYAGMQQISAGFNGSDGVKFKKGDLLTTKNRPNGEAVARVVRVTKGSVVHCVNLVACSTMKIGAEFQITQDVFHTWYVLHSRPSRRRW